MSEVFHSAGVPGATRCSESATGTEEARSLAAGVPPTGEAALRLKLDLCTEALRCIACGCLDGIELTGAGFDDGDGLLSRLLEKQLRMMGAEAEHVLRAVQADALLSPLEWVLSERQAEMVRQLEARP